MSLKYSIKRVPGGYMATVLLPTPRGLIRVTGTATYRSTAVAIRRVQRARGPQVSGFFGNIGRALHSLTKSKALRKAFQKVEQIASHPAVTAGLMAINPALGIGLMTSLKAIKAGNQLLSAAHEGSPGDAKRVMARATLRAAKYAAEKEKATGSKNTALALPGLASIPPQLQAALARYLGAVVPA